MSDPKKVMVCPKCLNRMTDIEAKRDGCWICNMAEYIKRENKKGMLKDGQ